MSRFETDMGDDGWSDPPCRMSPFGALYWFDGRTWEITVWAYGWGDAENYCKAHGLDLDGRITDRIEW